MSTYGKHWKMSEEAKRKMSNVRLGKTLEQMGHKPDCNCCACRSKRGEYKEKNHPRYGAHVTDETKEKISISILNYIKNNPVKAHNDLSRAGTRCQELYPDIWQAGLKTIEDEIRQEIPEKYHGDKRKAARASCISQLQQKGPNGPEGCLIGYIQLWNIPFQYTGNGYFSIGNERKHYPDFTSTNHLNAVIEIFGSKWHAPEDEQEYIAHYKQFGYKCYILWVKDLYNMSEQQLVEWLKSLEY